MTNKMMMVTMMMILSEKERERGRETVHGRETEPPSEEARNIFLNQRASTVNYI